MHRKASLGARKRAPKRDSAKQIGNVMPTISGISGFDALWTSIPTIPFLRRKLAVGGIRTKVLMELRKKATSEGPMEEDSSINLPCQL
jgi:hypothetical protein